MKTKLLLFVIIIFGSLQVFSKESSLYSNTSNSSETFGKRTINANDSIIFDLASATITATYIDIPVYTLSDDFISSFDFQLQFNLSKLTFSATIDLPTDPSILSLSFFNPTTLYLTYSTSTFSNYANYVQAVRVRFMLNTPCLSISPADFSNILGVLNGTQCSVRMTNATISQAVPSANFNNNPTCLNSNVAFTDASSISSGSITSWLWSFGNGNTSTLQNPFTSYTIAGAISVNLLVTAASGCTASITKPLTVGQIPTSSFSYSFNCIKDSVIFTNTSSISSGSITSSLWNFGDLSGTSSLTNPAHNYNASGNYTATLVSTSNFSCSSTSTVLVSLTNKVSANYSISATNFCIGSAISFSNASTYSLSTINAWAWNFGNGATSSQQNPSYTYTVSGTYSVTLQSTAADGCKGIITKTVTINAKPVVQFTATILSACATKTIGFNNTSTAPAGSTYLWNFGDGNTSTSQNPIYAYATSGTYPVKLVVKAPGGCADSLIKTSYIIINSTPVSNFSLSTTCVLTNINFINSSTISTGSIASWNWNLGDGASSTSTLQNPNYTYSVVGAYTVNLASTSNLGCVGSYTQVINVTNKPIANFTSTSLINCSGETLSFNNLSTPSSGPTYVWSFGNGGSSFQQNPVYTYSTSGFYTIKLVVSNSGACADSITKPYNVSLPLLPIPLFSDSVINNAVVSFKNLSTNAISYEWNFDDNQNSTLENPTHTFPDVLTYNVCLTAYNSLSCAATSCKNIYVGLSSIVAVPSAFTPNSDNSNDELKVRGGPFLEMEFKVLNEWGNLIFSSTSQNVGWDGRFNGELQPVGAYEYTLKAKTVENKNINLYGIVNLVR
jgi:gliding motility-associated-like protein